MTNEEAKARLAEIMGGLQQQVRNYARLQRERVELRAKGHARGGRVTVTLNAENTLVDVEFAANIGDLTYPDIADAIVEAARQAAAEVRRRNARITAPLEIQRAQMPTLLDLFEELGDLGVTSDGLEIPRPVEASVRPHGWTGFDGSVAFDGSAAPPERDDCGNGGRVTGSSW